MPTTPIPTPNAAQKAAATARLARNEIVGKSFQQQTATYSQIEDLAVQRLVTQGLSTAASADFHYGCMLKLLEEARLTISLKSGNWFYHENTYANYQNFFERGSSGASADKNRRDNVENAMFGYSEDSGDVSDNLQDTQSRIQSLGNLTSNNFQAAMRPRYSAVDFAFCSNGGLSKYGKSFLVLKEHLKHNATFCHCDSFEVEADMLNRRMEYGGTAPTLKDVTATYFQLGKLIYYCAPAMLRKIHEYALGKAKGSEANLLGGFIYLEAQVHADIVFSRDVEALHISSSDRVTGVIPHPMYQASFLKKKSAWDAADAVKVETNAKLFAARNKITYVSCA